MKKRVVIIGAGASGLMAACRAAGPGIEVTLVEKQKKTGRKLLATGNGRCNISNTRIDASRYHGRNPKWVNGVFSRFGLDDTVAFFESIGVPFVEGENGRLFPASLQASSVQKMLEYEAARRGVNIRLHRKIERILPAKKGIQLVTAGQEEISCDSLIVAAGSCAYSPLGASRDVYDLAASLGHRVYEPLPAIIPLNVPLRALHRMEGIKWDCRVTARSGGRNIACSTGEVLFTGYGISGPASLDVSRAVNASLASGQTPLIEIDFFPGAPFDELAQWLEIAWRDRGKPAGFGMLGILKERMPEVLLGLAGVDPSRPAGTLGAGEKDSIMRTLKKLELDPGPARPFSEAVVAAGGVCVDEIDPASMESRLAPRVHFTGEILDIDGDSGGFNLQFAWSTGAIAAEAVKTSS